MCFGSNGSTNNGLPQAPTDVTGDYTAIKEAQNKELQRQKQSQGRASTILTKVNDNAVAPTTNKTYLGQ
jgi:hypothetical protein